MWAVRAAGAEGVWAQGGGGEGGRAEGVWANTKLGGRWGRRGFGHTHWSEDEGDEWGSVGEALKAVCVVGSVGGWQIANF